MKNSVTKKENQIIERKEKGVTSHMQSMRTSMQDDITEGVWCYRPLLIWILEDNGVLIQAIPSN